MEENKGPIQNGVELTIPRPWGSTLEEWKGGDTTMRLCEPA